LSSLVYLGFDFGFKRIGVAVGQKITESARPLFTLEAKSGIPDWSLIKKLLDTWHPVALIVGLPTCIDDTEQFTTKAAKKFALELEKRFELPVHMVDERLSTVEARARLYQEGGYRKIKTSEVDSVAACIILEQWLQCH
jgi:putative Holliday junction resolvase